MTAQTLHYQEKNRNEIDHRSMMFDFHGFRIRMSADDTRHLSDIRTDFSHFQCDEECDEIPDLGIVFHDFASRPKIPRLQAVQHTPRNVVYRDGDITYLDYGGRALSVLSDGGRSCRIHSDDRHLSHEAAFLTILSHVGTHFDNTGRTRVHALGLETGGRAVLLLLPSSGGKTTMALRMLQTDGVRLLSEDSPLMRRNGIIEPFPMRIGVRPGTRISGVPERLQLDIERMEFGPKTLIDIEAFKDRLSGPVPIGAILIGKRFSAGESRMIALPRRAAIRPLISDAVVGLGLYQGVEFVLKSSPFELLGKGGLALSRLRTSLSVARRAEVHRFEMGAGIDQTAKVLTDFLTDFRERQAAT
ncbi:MAG: hypothetical protein CMJ67_09490 [Planctomycetaceae bacterium]|nr:hypothetical protein [Planctomycetaceae bacterium]